MLDRLVASRPSPRWLRGAPELLAATLAHGVVLAGAVLLTLPTRPVTRVTSIPITTVVPFRSGPVSRAPAMPRPLDPAPTPDLPQPIAFPTAVPDGLPDVGVDSIGRDWMRSLSYGDGGTPGPAAGRRGQCPT